MVIVPAGTYDDTFALRSAELWEQRPPQPLWLGEASVPRRAIILSNDKFNDWVAKAAYDDATAAGAVRKIEDNNSLATFFRVCTQNTDPGLLLKLQLLCAGHAA